MDDKNNTRMVTVKDDLPKNEAAQSTKKIPKWLGVEVVMIIYFMVMPPGLLLIQQFFYSVIAVEKNFKISNDSQGYCGPDRENITEQDELQVIQLAYPVYMMYIDI